MTSLSDIEITLAAYVPLAKEITGKDLTLARMVPLMAALGNPQEKLKIIHIAGTSGKTSTAYYVASMLTLAGNKTGLTVSPHVDSVLERIQINMHALDEAEFGRALAECITIIEEAGIEPTYFELLVAFAYWYFAKEGVDYAVIETGLGGLQDGTNVAQNQDKLCIITDIGLDHMHVLGHTVPEIARQKAGIIWRGNTAIMYRQSDEIMQVFKNHSESAGAELIIVDEAALIADAALAAALDDLPEFQQRNWLLAHSVLDYIGQELSPENCKASMHLHIPGRMDTVAVGNKTIVMDGAHNEQKTEAFVRSFQRRYPGKKVPVLLSLKLGKEFMAVLPLLKPICSQLVVTKFSSGQERPSEAVDPQELAEVAGRFGFTNTTSQLDPVKAYEELLAATDSVGIITGSFYLLGELRSAHPELQSA